MSCKQVREIVDPAKDRLSGPVVAVIVVGIFLLFGVIASFFAVGSCCRRGVRRSSGPVPGAPDAPRVSALPLAPRVHHGPQNALTGGVSRPVAHLPVPRAPARDGATHSHAGRHNGRVTLPYANITETPTQYGGASIKPPFHRLADVEEAA